MMMHIPYLQICNLFFVFYICENPYLLLCFGHISTIERPHTNFQVLLLHLMIYIPVVNIPVRISLSSLDICSRKSRILHQSYVIFQIKLLSNFPYFLFLVTFLLYHHIYFCYLTILLYTSFLLGKPLSMKKVLSIKQHIKASVGTYLENFSQNFA